MPSENEDAEIAPRPLELRLTPNARNPVWQLRAGGPDVHVALLGWVMDRPPIDAGVPTEVAGIIARAACRSHLLTFPHPMAGEHAESAAWTRSPWGWTCILDPPAWRHALGKPRFPMVATSDPETARELFSAAPFHWELRGQVVLLSDSRAAPPPLEYDYLERLFGKESLNRVSTRLPPEFSGLILPGIDGDFVELATFDKGATLPEAIAAECARAQVGWKIVPESDFLETSWHGQHDS